MGENVDIQKQLEVKNREIYLNKLTIDLDNNLEILLITINNIINMLVNEINGKINDFDNQDTSSYLSTFHKEIVEKIEMLIKKKIDNLKKGIEDIDNLDYKETINLETQELLENAKKLYSVQISTLINNLKLNKDDVNVDYLNNYCLNKFVQKLEETFNNMDIILYNKYLESNEKFKDLNAKTLNRV